ncbi:hypothetical protein Bca52824_079202 [Brassica carinata]|uniref:Rho GDP-dissociation inhibitor 1-like n=1 Tax=Brassica carinata TaxID=52824 RepID=A0A8X7Q0P6_BRACI|nr:hypothetical protein Bca52824_079202 [Brassica carinata]
MVLKEEENIAGESSEDQKGKGVLSRKNSHGSLCPTDDDDEDEDKKLELGPMIALKEQLEKDKDDESLRRWKEQLLGSVDMEEVGETPDPVVKIMYLTIRSPDREDMVLTVPEDEGSKYTLVFTFRVTNNIVSGLRYSNSVWKTGLKVYSRKEMLGTFSPQAEPYTHVMFEESTPSGMLVRGSYSVKSKFVDDDNKCYLENNYTFDIRKNWL